MNEEYRPIKDFENYEISNLGNIKRYGKIKKSRKRKDGYLDISLSKNNKVYRFLVHRLVAISFLNNPLNKEDINHLDLNRSNNKLENLEWATTSENIKYSYDKGSMVGPHLGKFGKDHHTSKKIIQKTLDDKIVKIWDSIADANRAGFCRVNISSCCRGKIKFPKKFKWEYL